MTIDREYDIEDLKKLNILFGGKNTQHCTVSFVEIREGLEEVLMTEILDRYFFTVSVGEVDDAYDDYKEVYDNICLVDPANFGWMFDVQRLHCFAFLVGDRGPTKEEEETINEYLFGG